jgi:hypothetical protein
MLHLNLTHTSQNRKRKRRDDRRRGDDEEDRNGHRESPDPDEKLKNATTLYVGNLYDTILQHNYARN